jgi:hypothetical protein
MQERSRAWLYGGNLACHPCFRGFTLCLPSRQHTSLCVTVRLLLLLHKGAFGVCVALFLFFACSALDVPPFSLCVLPLVAFLAVFESHG